MSKQLDGCCANWSITVKLSEWEFFPRIKEQRDELYIILEDIVHRRTIAGSGYSDLSTSEPAKSDEIKW